MSTDTITRQMHESRARRLVDAETRAAAAEAIRKDLEERLVDAEARASAAEDRARDVDVPGILPDRLYTVGTEIPNGENGVMAVIDISYGTIYVRHSTVNDLWRKMEPGLDKIFSEGADVLGDGGPWLPIGQEEDAGGLVRAVAAYDLVDRALWNLEREVGRPESAWRREVHHGNVAEWATARIRHADEALRRSQARVRELEDELANWRSGYLTAVAR